MHVDLQGVLLNKAECFGASLCARGGKAAVLADHIILVVDGMVFRCMGLGFCGR